jgi:hypothetical protein
MLKVIRALIAAREMKSKLSNKSHPPPGGRARKKARLSLAFYKTSVVPTRLVAPVNQGASHTVGCLADHSSQ